MQHTTQDSPAAAYSGLDRRESERRAAASASEFARGQKFGRLEAADEIARLTAERDRLVRSHAQIERLSREADCNLVNVTALLGDVARAALASINQGGEK